MAAKKTSEQDYKQYHRDGSIWAVGKTIDGIPTGYWEWFCIDGTKLRSGHFEAGDKAGAWTTYDKKGKVYKVTNVKPKPAE